jgi:hypothetical protein
LEEEIKEDKKKVAEEVNFTIAAEVSALPKLSAQIELRGLHLSSFFGRK